MKLFVVFCVFVAIACTSVSSAPQAVYDGTTYELKPIEGSVDGNETLTTDLPPTRHRRLTCEFSSSATLWATLSSVCCGIRCMTQGRKGGRCQDGVCVCE